MPRPGCASAGWPVAAGCRYQPDRRQKVQSINQSISEGKKAVLDLTNKNFLSLYVEIVQLEILITRSERWKKISQCFGSWLFPEPDRIFWPEFRSGLAENPDPDHWKNSWNCNYKYIFVYIIFGTLNIVLFVQVTPKPNQKHHLDLIRLLMEGSGFLKNGSVSAKKPGSIRIRNTEISAWDGADVTWPEFQSRSRSKKWRLLNTAYMV